MNCDWPRHWTSNQPNIGIMAGACAQNFLTTETLDPGQSYERTAPLYVTGNTGTLTFQFRFHPASSKDVYFSNPLTLTIVPGPLQAANRNSLFALALRFPPGSSTAIGGPPRPAPPRSVTSLTCGLLLALPIFLTLLWTTAWTSSYCAGTTSTSATSASNPFTDPDPLAPSLHHLPSIHLANRVHHRRPALAGTH